MSHPRHGRDDFLPGGPETGSGNPARETPRPQNLSAETIAAVARLMADSERPRGRRADQVRSDCAFEVKSLFVRCVFRRKKADDAPVADPDDGFAGGLLDD